jgi:hypothetical protein
VTRNALPVRSAVPFDRSCSVRACEIDRAFHPTANRQRRRRWQRRRDRAY